MSEILSLNDIESSKVYVSEVSQVLNFSHPLDYLQPFFDILNPLGATFSFEGEVGGQSKDRLNEEFSDQAEYISYKRLICKAKLPIEFDLIPDVDNTFNKLTSEIGFVYALDGKAPEMRAYKGKRVTVCTNQCVFGADNVTSLNLAKSTTHAIYDSLRRYVDNAAKDYDLYKTTVEKLANNSLSGSKLKERIGHVIWECKKNTKLGFICASDMVTYLQDGKSKYALTNDTTNDWVLYNACTESLKKSNILDEALKTLLLEKIFNPN